MRATRVGTLPRPARVGVELPLAFSYLDGLVDLPRLGGSPAGFVRFTPLGVGLIEDQRDRAAAIQCLQLARAVAGQGSETALLLLQVIA